MSTQKALPTIDLAALRLGAAGRAGEIDRLREVSRDIGFFYFTGHGVRAARADALLARTREFFALPHADRDLISMRKSPHFRGYTRVGQEVTAGVRDAREQLDVGAEHPLRHRGPDDPAYALLDGPNQWPTALPALRTTVLSWMDELRPVAHELLQALLESLGARRDSYDEAFAHRPHIHLKLLRYPATAEPDQGVGAHKDYGFLTLLLQDEQGGLEVASRDGRWQRVEHRPGAFVVNLGELLELATDGYLVATAHRVRTPPHEPRYSIPFFYNPRLDAVIDPLPLPPDIASAAPGVVDDAANPLYAVYGDNALKGWIRAHPEVAELHHADLFHPVSH
jgi:isopenicillin N synthase-like dioxygenase